MKKTTLIVTLCSMMCCAPLASGQDRSRENNDGIEVSIPKYITGGVLGTTIGFGIGHGVQGRYAQKGWIFTLAEVVGLGVAIAGSADCDSSESGSGDDDWDYPRQERFHNLAKSSCPGAPLILLGFGTTFGFHIWETVDVWAGPKFDKGRNAFFAGGSSRLNVGLAAAQIAGTPRPALGVSWNY